MIDEILSMDAARLEQLQEFQPLIEKILYETRCMLCAILLVVPFTH